MNHIRFMTTRNTVCMAPGLLGTDFVVVDFDSGQSCRVCTQLLEAHNKQAYEREQFERLAIARNAQGQFEKSVKNVGYGVAYISNDKPKSNLDGWAILLTAILVTSFWVGLFFFLGVLGVL